jgi:hypothetical protein
VRAFGSLLLAVGSGGCLGGQTGTEGTGTTTKDPENAAGSACTAQSQALTAAELSPLGFSVESALSVASGSRTAPLVWAAVPQELIGFGPEQGTSTVAFNVEASSMGARFVHWLPRAAGPDVGGCPPDEVQIDAQVSFATGGGAFAERFPAVLHATRADAVQVTLSLPLATLNGAFNVSPRANVRTSAVVLDATITADGTSGTLRGQLEQTIGMVQGVRFFTYACWPAGVDACFGL